MSIVYHEKTREFHLYNDKISYIFQIMRNGQLGQLYTGARLRDREDFSHLSELGFRDMAPCVYEGDRFFSLEALRQIDTKSIKYAVTAVTTLPLIICYPFVFKYFEKGVMVGSVKG